jgi:hypothetical protein
MAITQAEKRQNAKECKQIIKDIEVILATKMAQKHQRVEQVNQVIRIIADHGRRFFYNAGNQTYASMHIDKFGKIWFVDDYTQKAILTQKTAWGGRWKGFSNGGTLRALVEAFRDYIRDGIPLPLGFLGPERFNDSNVWGYDEQGMKAVREQAGALPVFKQPASPVESQDASHNSVHQAQVQD